MNKVLKYATIPYNVVTPELKECMKDLLPNYNFLCEDDIKIGVLNNRLPVTTNKHLILHHLRKIMEGSSVADHIRIIPTSIDVKPEFAELPVYDIKGIPSSVPYNDHLEALQRDSVNDNITLSVPSRLIVDINSTRLAHSNLAKIVLTPVIESADHDRVHIVNSEIKSYNHNVDNFHNTFFMEEDIASRLKVHSINSSLQDFVNDATLNGVRGFMDGPHEYTANQCKDALYVLTDIIYYIDDDDLYRVNSKLNDGVTMVGCLHVPKTLELGSTGRADILFSQGKNMVKEGEIMLSKNKFMEELADIDVANIDFVMRANGNNHNYVSPVRFPQLQVLNSMVIHKSVCLNEDFILKLHVRDRVDCGATYYISFEIEKISQPTAADFINDFVFQNENNYTLNKLKYEAAHNNAATPVEATQRMVEYVETLNPILTIATERVKDELQKYKNAQIQRQENKNTVTLYDPNGTLFGGSDYLKVNGNDLRKVVKVDKKLLNTLEAKIFAAEELNQKYIKELVLYLASRDKTLDLDDMMAIIATSLATVARVHGKSSLIRNSKLFSVIEKLNGDKYQQLPSSFWRALVSGQFFSYLKFNLFTKNDMGDFEKLFKDFH